MEKFSHKGLWKDCPLFSGRKCVRIYRKVYYGCPLQTLVHYGEIVLSLVFIKFTVSFIEGSTVNLIIPSVSASIKFYDCIIGIVEYSTSRVTVPSNWTQWH